MFKVIIAGGRDFNNYSLLKNRCEYYLQNITDDIEIVSGGARGADSLGERFANEKGYSITVFKAYWDILGNSAGYIRNKDMAKYADALIAFHDGKSKGTGHMIELAKERGLKIKVVKY